MTIPIVNNVYTYDNEDVIVWSQNLFFTVYVRTLVEDGGSEYKTINWWKFIFKAKYKKKIVENIII